MCTPTAAPIYKRNPSIEKLAHSTPLQTMNQPLCAHLVPSIHNGFVFFLTSFCNFPSLPKKPVGGLGEKTIHFSSAARYVQWRTCRTALQHPPRCRRARDSSLLRSMDGLCAPPTSLAVGSLRGICLQTTFHTEGNTRGEHHTARNIISAQ